MFNWHEVFSLSIIVENHLATTRAMGLVSKQTRYILYFFVKRRTSVQTAEKRKAQAGKKVKLQEDRRAKRLNREWIR